MSERSPPLSRTSTYTARTIRLPEKVVHVVRNPTEAYNLRDVEWVIEGSEKHVLLAPSAWLILPSWSICVSRQPRWGPRDPN
jgi:hypothetical protein